MGRLIDADALREHMYHEAFETDSGLQKWDSGLWIRYKMFEDILNTEITIDAEPVRHGRWIKNERYSDEIERHTVYECSECGELCYWFDVSEHKYCRHCGARMNEVTE